MAAALFEEGVEAGEDFQVILLPVTIIVPSGGPEDNLHGKSSS
jgi:hypothetical protein